MSLIKPLVTYKPLKDNSMLTTCIAVQDYSDAQRRQELHETLKANCEHYRGLGIASNQLGMNERAFYMDGTTYFNPEVLEFLDEGEAFAEGCLSFFSVKACVVRYSSIRVSYMGLDGGVLEKELQGLDAIAFQHELDHLDGVTMADRIKASLSKKRFIDKVKKIQRKAS